jgi:hypothetical protein
MHQVWHDLLFMHWRVPVAALRPHVPAQLPIDTFDGDAWIAIVPFRMSGIRPRLLPAVPGLSAFPELNVRTYVTLNERPGVWFFSLDAANALACSIARNWFSLPYFHARMTCAAEGEGIRYASSRVQAGAKPAALECSYAPTGAVFHATPDSLEWFLTARYCLYAQRGNAIHRGEIEHAAWPLQPARCSVAHNSMTRPIDLTLTGEPHLLFTRRIDVVVWTLERAG